MLGAVALAIACGVVFSLSALGICHAFRQSFAHLAVSDVTSPQLKAVLQDLLSISPSSFFRLGLRARVMIWPLGVTIVLAAVSELSSAPSYRNYMLEGLLPHWYSMFANNLDSQVANPLDSQSIRAAIMMVLTYLLIRLPRPHGPQTPGILEPEVGFLEKIVGFYYWTRRIYLEEIVFWGKRSRGVVELAIDLKKQWLAPARVDPAVAKRVMTELASTTGQPKDGSDHQIIIGYLERVGQQELVQELRHQLTAPRTEVRRELKTEVELVHPRDASRIKLYARRVGFADLHAVGSIEVEGGEGVELLGNYRLDRLAGRRIRGNLLVELKEGESSGRFLKVSPPSRGLGKSVSRCFCS